MAGAFTVTLYSVSSMTTLMAKFLAMPPVFRGSICRTTGTEPLAVGLMVPVLGLTFRESKELLMTKSQGTEPRLERSNTPLRQFSSVISEGTTGRGEAPSMECVIVVSVTAP